MKKLLILGLVLTFILSFTTMVSAKPIISPEFGMLYTTAPGNPLVAVGGVTVYIHQQVPMFGFRVRAGYRVNGNQGLKRHIKC